MGSSKSTVLGLYLWPGICWRAFRSIASLIEDTHQPHARRPILETETVFGDILDTDGNIVCGEHSVKIHGKSYPACYGKVAVDRATLLRGYVTSCSGPIHRHLISYRLLQGPSVDVYVGPENTQFSVPKNLLFHYSKMARGSFGQHRGNTHFKEYDENALCLPEHAPETFEFVLKWMYQNKLGVLEYCKVLFTSQGKANEGVEAAFLLLCRMYILADYMEITEIIERVMGELGAALRSHTDPKSSPIGPDAVKTVFRNTSGGSPLQELILINLAESLRYNSNGRPIEMYAECFSECEGFGAAILKHVLELRVDPVRFERWRSVRESLLRIEYEDMYREDCVL